MVFYFFLNAQDAYAEEYLQNVAVATSSVFTVRQKESAAMLKLPR